MNSRTGGGLLSKEVSERKMRRENERKKKGKQVESFRGFFQEAKHPERGQRALGRRKERYEYHGSLDLLYQYIVSFLFSQ